jgi:hypothetical protein
LGPASLVLYDVSTLYFETDAADGFREPGFSKERRLEPQITIGLLTDAAGFPLTVQAFEGNKAETAMGGSYTGSACRSRSRSQPDRSPHLKGNHEGMHVGMGRSPARFVQTPSPSRHRP